MKVAIYARYSSVSQREVSIEEQVNYCTNYAKRHKYTVVKIYRDKAMSGKTDDRPQLQELLTDSSTHMFQAILVYSIDRFSRNLRLGQVNLHILNENGVRLISATEDFPDGAPGTLFKNMMMCYAQFYSDELSEKIRRGIRYNAENGIYNGGGISLGYRVGPDKRFEVDPDAAQVVQSVFEMYADGKTVAEIVNILNKQGKITSKGVPFNKNSLHDMLHNKRYIGYSVYKDEEYPGMMPQIISEELFNKVQERLAVNKKARAHSKAKEEYLLTTKLYCGYCKKMMTGFSGTGKQGKIYRYYICNGTKERPKTCDKKRVNKNYIEDLVVRECRRLLSAENIRRIAKEVMTMASAEKDTSELKRLKKLLIENERKQKNTIDAITESDIESVRKALGAKIPELEEEHRGLEQLIAKEEEVYPTLTEEEILFFLNALKKGRVDDVKYCKMLISVFVNRIYLYDDRITITFNSGDKPVTVNDEMLSDLEAREEEYKALFDKDRVLFFDGSGPPRLRNPNLIPIGNGFGFLVYIEDIGI